MRKIRYFVSCRHKHGVTAIIYGCHTARLKPLCPNVESWCLKGGAQCFPLTNKAYQRPVAQDNHLLSLVKNCGTRIACWCWAKQAPLQNVKELFQSIKYIPVPTLWPKFLGQG